MVDTSKFISMISNQFANIINNNLDYYGGTKFLIQEERAFLKDKNEDEIGCSYIVIKFLSASIYYNQTAIPVVMQCVCSYNEIEKTRNLLYEFAEKYNLYWNEDKTLEQVWETPSIDSNFEELYEGFDSIISMAGALLILDNGNLCTIQYSPMLIIANQEEDANKKKVYYIKDDFPDDIETYTKIYNPSIDIDKLIKYLKDNKYSIQLKQKGVYYFQKSVDNGFWELFNAENDEKQESGNYTIISSLNECGVNLSVSDENKPYYLEDALDKIKFYLDNGYADVNYLSFTTHAAISLDSQPFFVNNNFTQSKGKFGSFSMNLTTYLFDNDFLNKCLNVYLGNIDIEKNGIDTKFEFKLKFNNGIEKEKSVKLADLSLSQATGEIPVVSLTFSE